LLHLVGSSILLYLIDDARSNKNQVANNLECLPVKYPASSSCSQCTVLTSV